MAEQKRLSICMFSDDFLPGATGVGTHLQEICPQLARRGHQISVITTRRSGQPERETWQGVQIHRVATAKVFGFYQALPSAATIRSILAQIRPHLVHYHYLGVMFLRALKVVPSMGLPQIYTYHMTEDHLTQPLPMRPFRPWFARQIVNCCNRTDLVISVSRTLAGQLPGKGIKTPISYISNPVGFEDTGAVVPAPREADLVVMFAGRLNPEKNLPYLLNGFSKFLAAYPNAVLWIAGEGSQRNQLENQCRTLGIQERVKFLGFLKHDVLARYYAACDVFVLPSLIETQGLVAMEAMWFGKPIVVADSVVSAPELVDEGVNGFIVDHNSEADLAQRLTQLGADPALRIKMGAAGRQKAEAFRPEAIVATLESEYLKALERFQSAADAAGRGGP